MFINCGKNIEIDVDFTKLPENVRAHALYIGVKNLLTDCHASITAKVSDDVTADSRPVVERKLAAMYSGDMRVSSSRSGDAVRSLAIKLASAKAVEKSGKKRAEIDSKALREVAVHMVETDAQYMDAARKAIESTKAHESEAVDATVADLIAKL